MATGKVYAVRVADESATTLEIVSFDFSGAELGVISVEVTGTSDYSRGVYIRAFNEGNTLTLSMQEHVYTISGEVISDKPITSYYPAPIVQFAGGNYLFHNQYTAINRKLFQSEDAITWTEAASTFDNPTKYYTTYYVNEYGKYYHFGLETFEAITTVVKYDADYNYFNGTAATIPSGDAGLMLGYWVALKDNTFYGVRTLNDTSIPSDFYSISDTDVDVFSISGSLTGAYGYEVYINELGKPSALIVYNDTPQWYTYVWELEENTFTQKAFVAERSGDPLLFLAGSVISRFSSVPTTNGYAYLEKYVSELLLDYPFYVYGYRVVTPVGSAELVNTGINPFLDLTALAGTYEVSTEFWTEEVKCIETEFECCV